MWREKRIERFLVRKCRCPFFKQFKGDTSAVLMLHTWHYNSIHWTNTDWTKFSSLAYHLWNDNMATYTVRLNICMCTYNIWSTRNSEILAKLNALAAGENLKKNFKWGWKYRMLYCFMCIIMQLMSLDNSTTPLILNVANNNYNLYMYIHLYIL